MNDNLIQLQPTRKEFEGDITMVVFPLLKISRKSREQTANDLGGYLVKNAEKINRFNVIKGFLNLVIEDQYWIEGLNQSATIEDFGFKPITEDSKLAMVEYSSPNTNKPLHLGHIRNNLLGYSISEILKANGNKL